MNVLYILFSKGWGGLERYAIGKAQAMAERGHDIYFLRLKNSEVAKALDEINMPGEEWDPVRYVDVRAIWGIRSLVKQMGVSIVHTHHSADLGLAATALWHMPDVKLLFSNYMQAPGLKHDLYHRLEYSRVDKIIVGADSMRQNSVKNLPMEPDNVITIPYGLDMDKFDPDKKPKGALRNKHGIDNGALVAGVISRLDPLKGQMEMIEAAPAIFDRFPDAYIILTGDETPEYKGRYMPLLEKKVKQLGFRGKIIFTGPTDDTASILADLDVYVLPSHSETFALGLIEAMAMGKAVVGTDAGGTPDILDNKTCGLLAQPKSPKSLAEKVITLFSDATLRKTLGQNARSKVAGVYDRKLSMDKLDALYQEVAST